MQQPPSPSASAAFVSRPYTIRRMELTYAFSEIYVRALWWALIGMPISGILVLALLPQPIMKYIGAVMILWPITIPEGRRCSRPTKESSTCFPQLPDTTTAPST